MIWRTVWQLAFSLPAMGTRHTLKPSRRLWSGRRLCAAPPEGPTRRYSSVKCTGIKKIKVEGNPDPKHVSTSYVERQNLTMRMHMCRFTRLTNAFSKKFESHAHIFALYSVWYNFVRVPKTPRMSPATAAGVSVGLWSMEDVAALIDANEAPAKKRGPYKKREEA